ncbi:hypothetical protein EI94DRAFT_1729172 [Lactarius quietus]|nr:hypothetical protein EI94DRAFT_1729172 [Lactarius quietus]
MLTLPSIFASLSGPPQRPPCLLHSRRSRTSISPAAAAFPPSPPTLRQHVPYMRSTPPPVAQLRHSIADGPVC